MKSLLIPVDVPSLPASVVDQIEKLILSGRVQPGQRLAPERELASSLGVSRPVVHSALLELEQKGLVAIRPRHGVVVTDFRKSGSAELLSSLWRHGDVELEPSIIESFIEFRVTMEGEAAGRLAGNPDSEALDELKEILDRGDKLPDEDPQVQAGLDYEFHFAIALHSGNIIYPMILNSFREVYLSLLSRFYIEHQAVPRVRVLRRKLLEAIEQSDVQLARDQMRELSRADSYE